jgi:hypothetical protein
LTWAVTQTTFESSNNNKTKIKKPYKPKVMKFLLVALTAVFSLFSTSSNAKDVKVSSVVLQSFNSSFENASEVKWSASNNYYKAEFNFNGQYISAYYEAGGCMIAATKNITSVQLPFSLQQSLKKNSENFWISELFELNDDSGTSYYVTLENGDTKVVLKSNSTRGWETYQKHRKS